MAATETKHLEDALAKAREVYLHKIANADTALENWRNEAARRIRQSAENIASLESGLELLDALEQERRAASTRLELHAAIQEHHSVVDGAHNLIKQAMLDHAKAYAAAGAAMGESLTQSFAA